jgi:hypothetical protein
MKRFLSGNSKKGEKRKKPEPEMDDAEGKDGGFSVTDGCLMIFSGTMAYGSKRHQKLVRRKVYAITFTDQTIRRAFTAGQVPAHDRPDCHHQTAH